MIDVLHTIKQLSEIDEKSLSQKTLKLGEEYGELAKVVLPYDNGFATTHRFVTANKILEEVVDTLLCSLSIAYDLGFSDDDIADVMKQKCIKWSSLQQKSIKGQYPLPFEIHITVQSPILPHLFTESCHRIGVKPIILDLVNVHQDMMTSSIIVTDNKGAFNQMQHIARELENDGFTVIRKKIETVPWHPASPLTDEEVNPNQYFECHFNLLVNDEELAKLKGELSNQYIPLHFSKNRYKRINDDDFIQMITLRSTSSNLGNTKGEFEDMVKLVVSHINTSRFLREGALQKYNIEYALYDTNISHDTNWINGDQ